MATSIDFTLYFKKLKLKNYRDKLSFHNIFLHIYKKKWKFKKYQINLLFD